MTQSRSPTGRSRPSSAIRLFGSEGVCAAYRADLEGHLPGNLAVVDVPAGCEGVVADNRYIEIVVLDVRSQHDALGEGVKLPR